MAAPTLRHKQLGKMVTGTRNSGKRSPDLQAGTNQEEDDQETGEVQDAAYQYIQTQLKTPK